MWPLISICSLQCHTNDVAREPDEFWEKCSCNMMNRSFDSIDDLEQFLSAEGKNVTSLEIISSSEQKDLDSILKLLPNVEHLELSVNFKLSEEVTLGKLTSLKLFAWSHAMLQFIDAPELIKFELSESCDAAGHQNVIAYLMKCSKLCKLSLGFDIIIFELLDTENFPFNLKKLEVICSLTGFVSRHSIKRPRKYRQIFSLFLNVVFFPFDRSTISRKKILHSFSKSLDRVWKLKINSHVFESLEDAEAFHSLFPNIKILVCNNYLVSPFWTRDYLKIIAKLHPKLENLFIKKFVMLPGNIRFKNLKTLSLREITNSDLKFIFNHPTLEHIFFGDPYKNSTTSEDFCRILKLPNLKRIAFQGPLQSVKKFYDIIKRDCKKLSKLAFRVGHDEIIIIEVHSDFDWWFAEQYFEDCERIIFDERWGK